MSREAEEDDLTAFERSLAALTPAKAFHRDRLMYEAGRRAGLRERRGGRLWPALAASLAMVAAGQGIMLARRPADRVEERVAVEPSRQPEEAPVVILTRREPPPTPVDVPSEFDRRLRAGAVELLPEPPLLSAAVLAATSLPEGSNETLNLLQGRRRDLQSITGGPL